MTKRNTIEREQELNILIESELKKEPEYISLRLQRLMLESDYYNDGMGDVFRDCYCLLGEQFAKYLKECNHVFSKEWAQHEIPQIFTDFLRTYSNVEKQPNGFFILHNLEFFPAIELETSLIWWNIFRLESNQPGYFTAL